MNYPDEFKAKVKRVHPLDQRLHEMLDKGSTMVGRVLDDSQYEIDAREAKRLLKSGSVTVGNALRRVVETAELYDEWGKLYDKEFPR